MGDPEDILNRFMSKQNHNRLDCNIVQYRLESAETF